MRNLLRLLGTSAEDAAKAASVLSSLDTPAKRQEAALTAFAIAVLLLDTILLIYILGRA